jgi:hypothetical protein
LKSPLKDNIALKKIFSNQSGVFFLKRAIFLSREGDEKGKKREKK